MNPNYFRKEIYLMPSDECDVQETDGCFTPSVFAPEEKCDMDDGQMVGVYKLEKVVKVKQTTTTAFVKTTTNEIKNHDPNE